MTPPLAAVEPPLAAHGGARSTAAEADELFNARRWADAARAFEEVTKDDGKTWAVQYDFTYIRKK